MALNALRPFLLYGLICIFFSATELHSAIRLIPFVNKEKKGKMPIEEQDAQAEIIMSKASALQDKNRNRSARRSYKKIWIKYPDSSQAPYALLETGKILADKGSWKKAYPTYQKIISLYPDYPEFNEVIEKQFEIATMLEEGSGPRFLFLFRVRNYQGAIGGYELVVRNAPYHKLAPEALMNIALMHERKKSTYRAIDSLDRLINYYPDNKLASDAYLKLADIFSSEVKGPAYDQGPTREAISYYEDFLILFSDSSKVSTGEQGLEKMNEVYARSKYQRGLFYYKYRKNYRAAKVFFNEAITVSPGSSSAIKAREYLDKIDSLTLANAEQKVEQTDTGKSRRFPVFRSKKKQERPTIKTELLKKEEPAENNSGNEENKD